MIEDTLNGFSTRDLIIQQNYNDSDSNILNPELLRIIFDSTQEGIAIFKFIMDREDNLKDLIILEFNQAFEKLMDLDRTDLIGKSIREVIDFPEEELNLHVALPAINAGENVFTDVYFKTINKYIRVNLFKAGKPLLCVIFSDISELKQKNADLELFRTIIDKSIIPAILVSEDSTFAYFNDALCTFTGYTREEMINFTPFNLEKNLSINEWNNSELNKCIVNETFITRKDGSTFPAEIHGGLLEQDDKLFRYAYIVDQTNHKNIENILSEQKAHLESIVNNQTARLKAVIDELKLKNNALEIANLHREKFLSALSHELRTPLTSIMGYSHLISLQGSANLSPVQQDYLSRIIKNSEYLTSLIEQLLNITKIDKGLIKLKFEQVSPADIIYDVIDSFERDAIDKQIQLGVDLDKSIPEVLLDLTRFKEIIYNLLSNALKYTHPGGKVTISLKLKENNYFCLIVKDTGIGISQDKLSLIFDDFYQVPAKETNQVSGLGLGLAITRRLVKLHGGSIEAESKPGEGATFILTFPFDQSLNRSDSINLPFNITYKPIRNKKILVVEDMEDIRNLISDILEKYEIKPLFATNGVEAIEISQKYKPDLIFMDIQMPVMDGLDATRIIKSNPDLAHIPIVALTASVYESSKQKQIEAGCQDHISKPVNLEYFDRIIRKYLL